MAVTLAKRPPGGRDPGDRQAAPKAHGEVRHRRRRPAVRHDGAGRKQERRAADPRRQRPHRGRGGRAQRAAHPRRRGDARDPRGDRRRRSAGAGPTRWRCAPPTCTRSRSSASSPSSIRASFLLAGPLLARFGRAVMPPPGRRRDRPPAPGSAPGRVPRDGRGRPTAAREIVLERPARPAPDRRVHGRAVGDGDRERADGRRADARARPSSATPPASRTSRTSRACS